VWHGAKCTRDRTAGCLLLSGIRLWHRVVALGHDVRAACSPPGLAG
jgi:hypothetical protein